MAGHNYLDASGGSEFLCLPQDVTWAQPGPNDTYSGQLYGTEYDMPTEVGSRVNLNAPCCLCKTRRSTAVMFPARTNCFPGWTLEYTGYLGAGVRTQTLTNYVCVDSSPETILGGAPTDYAASIHNVAAVCGSLPCPPFVDGRPLACAVCSV